LNKTEILETIREIKQKVSKFIPVMTKEFCIGHAELKLHDAFIWLDKYVSQLNKELDLPKEEIEQVAEVQDIHNDTGKLNYKISYLTHLTERLSRYGEKTHDPLAGHYLLMAIDHIHEAIGYYEKAK